MLADLGPGVGSRDISCWWGGEAEAVNISCRSDNILSIVRRPLFYISIGEHFRQKKTGSLACHSWIWDFFMYSGKWITPTYVLVCPNLKLAIQETTFVWFLMNELKFTPWMALSAPCHSTSFDMEPVILLLANQRLHPNRCSHCSGVQTAAGKGCQNTIAIREDFSNPRLAWVREPIGFSCLVCEAEKEKSYMVWPSLHEMSHFMWIMKLQSKVSFALMSGKEDPCRVTPLSCTTLKAEFYDVSFVLIELKNSSYAD